MSEVAAQTLHIVARELNNELNDARAALENFGEHQDDVRYLENCRDRLHAVHGALRVAEVYGAALLAEEMEQLARYLVSNFAEKRHLAEGLDALMRAMVQLPTYLERVLGGGRDMALILLPLLNDLRAVRGHALLSEGTLLLLNLTSEKQANPLPPAPGEVALPVANWARKLRPRYQLGLLGWIKGERVEQNLDILARAAEKLEQVATTQSVFQLWWVIGAVIEALIEGGLEGSASIKRLLGQADRELKRLYEQGEAQYAERPPVELLNNLLYYLARSASDGPRVAAVRASFRLDELLPVDQQVEAARESLAAPSVKLMKTVAAAIKEDLARVKDALDIFVRKSGTQAAELAPQLELLRKIGDTLGVLGLASLRDKVQDEMAGLQKVVASNAPVTEAMLMRMAGTLINIETGLDEQLVGLILPAPKSEAEAQAEAAEGRSPGDDIEFRQVTEAVLRECIVNMARIKEAIALSVERPKEAQVLEQVPPLIHGITAGLLMLGKTRAVELTEAIGKALPKYVRADGVPVSHEAMDRLADAIVAVEYYMETLHAGRADPWYMLDNAEACLQALSDLHTGSELSALHDVADFAVTMAVEPTVSASTLVLDRADRTALLGAPETPQATQVIPSQQAAKRASLQETRVMPEQKGVRPAAKAPPVLAPPADKADPEFVELFIEEAREEIAKLQNSFPLWEDNPQDAEALANLRRSFHTLKGSGRMVGAQLIGEFAWSIENMLNRVINKTLPRSADMMQLMRTAVAVVPELVEQLESGRAPQIDVPALIAQANAIAMVREANAAAPVDSEAGEDTSSTQRAAIPVKAAAAKPLTMPPPVAKPSPGKPTVAPAMPPVQSAAAPAEPMDDVLREIFSKETAGHLKAIRDYIGSCALLTPPYPVTEALHRACHTLSGTAKTAGARQGIKIAEPLNHYVRKLYDNNLGLPAAGMQVLRDSVRAIENVVEHIGESTGFFVTHTSIVERIGKLEEALDAELATLGHSADITAVTPAPVIRMPQADAHDDIVELAFDADSEHKELGIDAPTNVLRALQVEDGSSTAEVMIDPSVMQDAPAHVASSTDATARNPIVREPLAAKARADEAELEVEDIDLSDDLNGDAAEEAAPELVVETAAWAANFEPPTLPSEPAAAANEPSISEDIVLEEQFDEPIAPAPVVRQASHAAPVRAAPPPARQVVAAPEPEDDAGDDDFDADVAAIFTEEAAELLETADAALASWSRDRSNDAMAFELKRALHTLKGGARMAGIRAMGDLSHELESFMQGVESGQVAADQHVLDLLQASLDELHRMRDIVSGGRRVKSARELIARIRAASGLAAPEIAVAHEPTPQQDVQFRREFESSVDVVLESSDAAEPQPIDVVLESSGAEGVHLDFELPAEEAPAGTADEVIEIGAPEEATIEDEAAEAFAEPLPPAMEVAARTSAIAAATPQSTEREDLQAVASEDADAAAAALQQNVALPPGRDSVQQERGEVARVDAELLDMLLNNAGEVSILRSRLEQQTNSIDSNLAELGRTVARLKEQLRKLEIETEAQILHRHQEEGAGRADFDPLELDRYSQLQQLSRALAESVSDVASIEGLLETQVREAQNLLLQQSRVVTEVQNGLMKTRMVPFQRHVQRLSRIVRQVASETGKRADLVVSGASGELDRQVLERMLPPLEHMLRNSVVHGIETPNERKAAGKPEVGTIRIDLHREGSEMVIVVSDDGRGIDVKAVRQRAIERGLLKAGRTISDEEALQLILEPGFSTAQTVTQHAGRGVGMDVVVAEIKKLGGALFTKSTFGHGVRFTIRLPFTLAISQSLIVRVGEEMYALPLSTVEGVARVPRSEVAAYLGQAEPVFNYGGQPYRVQHLGAFIDAPASTLPDADVPVPLILVNAGEHSTALVVDELVGNREIVVKPVGPQISGIRGVSGATILGDGRIVVILDMGALVRSGWRIRSDVAAPLEDRRTFALVVDDSITVRRVTQRLLERNGMRVMTAKDGVDALSVMQEHIPDIILLDIEMPRMDGYELAAQVRNDPRLADVPIIMITSRVGEKHRARAIELGVNDYLGKPYQENQLLDAIEPLVEARRRRVAQAARA